MHPWGSARTRHPSPNPADVSTLDGVAPLAFSISLQSLQKVHSKLQIMASVAVGGRSLLQHSLLGQNSNTAISFLMISN